MKKILFINYLLYRPDMPNVSGKYEMLSDDYHGDMTAICPRESDGIMLGGFRFRYIPYVRVAVVRHIVFIAYVLFRGLASNRRKKIDIVVSYDPLLCGVAGYVLKLFTGSRFVVEVNGDIINAGLLDKRRLSAGIHRWVILRLSGFILGKADMIKYLNPELAVTFSSLTGDRDHEVFVNFVPTYAFRDGPKRYDRYVLFVGYPFYLKGVDILIEAFNRISPRYPDFSLKIIGHCPDPSFYEKLADGNENIVIEKAVYYDDIIQEFRNCYCFVLPSRSEGMGRVLIEAMASGKAVIGSNVGGIPSIVSEGENGYLFECGNVEELAGKLEMLLGDEALARKLGETAQRHVEQNLSASLYISNFKRMIESIM